MQNIVFIINPISGTGRKDLVQDVINAHLDRERFSSSIRFTEYAGHAAELAREEVIRGTSVVVAVGGDGTVNEVARSLVNTNTALGIVPCGSGNGLARHLRIPLQVEDAIRIINECHIDALDYGTMNGEPFFCTCGVGFDAFISMKFAEAGKRGLATYVEKTLQDGLRYRPDTYHVEMDGETVEYEAFLIACANASQYGNNAYIAPEASTRDGLLDVTILTPFSPIEAPQIVVQMFNRRLTENSHVKTFRTRHIHITRVKPGPVHIDGDPKMMSDDLDISIHPSALRVVTNGHPGHRPLAFPKVQAFNNDLRDLPDTVIRDLRELQDSFFRNIIDPFHKHLPF